MKEFEISPQKALELDNMIEKKRSEYHSWKKNNVQCMYFSCDKSAINSHAISKEQSIRSISENGKVSYFKSRRDKNQLNGKELVFDTVGINEASTFKGFCPEHDKIFNRLDNQSTKYLVKEVLLQAYRSICFSLFNAEFTEVESKYSDDFLKDEFSIEKLKSYLELDKEVCNKISDDTIMKLFKNIYEEHLIKYNVESRLLRIYKKDVESYMNFHEDINASIENQNEYIFCKENCDVCILHKKINLKIPIALLNHHLLKIREQPNLFLITIVPYDDGTEIFWIFDKKYLSIFKTKWLTMIKKDINILNMIESSMMHCENWYIKTSVIRNIPTERLRIIEEDMYFNNERSPFDEYDLSIFDDLRKELIKEESDVIKDKEEKKITLSVSRESYYKRYEKYNMDVFDSI